jgi:hypothetical protein
LKVENWLKRILVHLAEMPGRYQITKLELSHCEMKGQQVLRLTGVLKQYPALEHLDLSADFNFQQPGQRGFPQ